ncbi:hypothetical protein [Streptomyces sp. Isolate_219]|nr:hypothetical protein [Streptomyces sp. Isolate_219]
MATSELTLSAAVSGPDAGLLGAGRAVLRRPPAPDGLRAPATAR